MKGLVFDIETRDVFDANKRKPEDLEISVVGTYLYADNTYTAYTVETLPELWEVMRDVTTLIGFNSNHFDIPLLDKYAPMDLRKEYRSIDLLESVRNSLGRRIRLDWIAEGTLGVKKTGDGLQAVEWWKRGEVEKIKEYCLEDVKITKRIFDYAVKNEEILYHDIGAVHTVPVDTSQWETETEPEEATMALF